MAELLGDNVALKRSLNSRPAKERSPPIGAHVRIAYPAEKMVAGEAGATVARLGTSTSPVSTCIL
jgi:hypothetical protein